MCIRFRSIQDMEEWCESFKLWKEYAIDYGKLRIIMKFHMNVILFLHYSIIRSKYYPPPPLFPYSHSIYITVHWFNTYVCNNIISLGNYEQGDENRQLGAKLDELKIDIEGDDDDGESGHGHQVVKRSWSTYIDFPPSILFCSHVKLSVHLRWLVNIEGNRYLPAFLLQFAVFPTYYCCNLTRIPSFFELLSTNNNLNY